ncbi:MAG: L-threonylcarbamoyladenylate synthase [Neisseriaceae bacterium]
MHEAIPQVLLQQTRYHLKCGGIVAYPTESCFALGSLPNHPQGIRNLLQLKKRRIDKGLIVIADQLSRFNSLVQPLSTERQACLEANWPAAKTYLVPAKVTTFPLLRGQRKKKLAIRVPDHVFPRSLCRQLRTAIVSTSANLNRQKPCKTLQEVRRRFKQRVLILPGRIGAYRHASQIIDLETGERIR